MDIIFIQGLQAQAQIGVYDWEQQIQQPLVFDIQMAWNAEQAAKTDDLRYALNYAEVSERVVAFAASQPFLLIERLAYELADYLRETYQLSWIKLTLHKSTAVEAADSVGIVVERGEK